MRDFQTLAASRFPNWSIIGNGPIALFYPSRMRTIFLCEDEESVEIARSFIGRERNLMRLDEAPRPKVREGFV